MERASRLVRKLKPLKAQLSDAELALRAWPVAVGERIAQHTRAVQLNGEELRVEVNDPLWQSQLRALESQILKNLNEILGDAIVRRLQFVVRIPKRSPAIVNWPGSSEATRDQLPEHGASTGASTGEFIEDPFLRKLYLISKKRQAL